MSGVTLVTGGAGFVGKSLVALLRERGEKTRSFDLAAPAHVDDVQGSITESAEVARAMDGVTSVFHLAGNAQLWTRNRSVFDRVNYYGAEIVAQAANAAGARMVHCSSLTTLVGRATPIGVSKADEETRLEIDQMLGAYPRSKLLAELAIEDAVRNGLNAVIAMPTEPLGPGDDSLTPPTQMILDFANGKTPAYIDCILNFVPVDSLAEGLIAARDRGRRGQRYLLGGENIPMTRLLAMIAKNTGRPAPQSKMPYWVALAAGAVDTKVVSAITGKPPKAPLTGVRLAGRQVSFSSEKAAKELGWRASPAEPALAAMMEWAQEKGLLA
ncbi:NAD-dependent epimerase/dehydratase family protein [Hyphococcus sp.]|uniref:NAD-dependent epimerase/dehydratase family protein n=1 Tax=Hyphococcus sp. TaxID=2038636 RepID=UPI00208025C9|nr:MAG: NAD-dependent dehydratase [Marinicaulis sp.]